MSGLPSDPESVISLTARAYVMGMIPRKRFEDVVRFALECERDSYRVGWPHGVPLPYQIKEAEAASRRTLSPLRRSRRALRRTLKAAILA